MSSEETKLRKLLLSLPGGDLLSPRNQFFWRERSRGVLVAFEICHHCMSSGKAAVIEQPPCAEHRIKRGNSETRWSSPKRERWVALSEDRGQFRTNTYGDFFLRKFADDRITCASPELENHKLIRGQLRARRLKSRSRSMDCHYLHQEVSAERSLRCRIHDGQNRTATSYYHSVFTRHRIIKLRCHVPSTYLL